MSKINDLLQKLKNCINDNKIIVICGATCSGKSALAMQIAEEIGTIKACIINADSMQVYKELAIITAQPSLSDQVKIQHYLYGFIEIIPLHNSTNEYIEHKCQLQKQHDQKKYTNPYAKNIATNFSVAVWLDHVSKFIIKERKNKIIIVVGGSGMYINALLYGISAIPEIQNHIKQYVSYIDTLTSAYELHKVLQGCDIVAANKLAPNDKKRVLRALEVVLSTDVSIIDWRLNNDKKILNRKEFFVILVNAEDRVSLYNKIDERFTHMIENGAIKEVQTLMHLMPQYMTLAKNNQSELNGVVMPQVCWYDAIGVNQIYSYIKGEITLDKAIMESQKLTRNYAKRQMTWFRNMIDYDASIML